jgi:peroxiredoxin
MLKYGHDDPQHAQLAETQERMESQSAPQRAATSGRTANTATPRTTIGLRERLMMAAGAVLGLALIVAVWLLAGRSAEPTLPTVAEVNRPAPAFTLRALDGGEVRLEDYRGKVVLLNFWGSWCEPCKEETPDLQRAHVQLEAEGLVIIGVNLWNQEGRDAEQKVRAFAESYGMSYPVALDTDGSVAQDYRLYPIPTSYFIDPQGNIRYIKASVLKASEIETLFRRLQQG